MKLLVNWAVILTSPIWVLPVFLSAIAVGKDRGIKDIAFGRTWFI